MRAHTFAATLFLASALSVKPNEPLAMAVSPAQSIAPTNLTIRVRVQPDSDDRAVDVAVDSGGYFRSSRIQLEGAEAPRTISFEFRNVPSGDYEVRGALINSAGRERSVVREEVIVIGPGGTP